MVSVCSVCLSLFSSVAWLAVSILIFLINLFFYLMFLFLLFYLMFSFLFFYLMFLFLLFYLMFLFLLFCLNYYTFIFICLISFYFKTAFCFQAREWRVDFQWCLRHVTCHEFFGVSLRFI